MRTAPKDFDTELDKLIDRYVGPFGDEILAIADELELKSYVLRHALPLHKAALRNKAREESGDTVF